MKKLSMFSVFLWDKFEEGKRFVCTGCSEWRDFDSGKVIGTKIETAIIEDRTKYDDPNVTNLYEKIVFKVGKDIKIPLNSEVRFNGVKATVFGEYRNQLSCTAENVTVVSRDKG